MSHHTDWDGQTNDTPHQYDFYFHGTGLEYFRIWIVNLLLIIITLGVYSPWAKVRRLRYFYGNTELNGEVFDFTANPKRILLGRLIALGIYIAISVASSFSPVLSVLGGILLALMFPWLLRSTLRFRARNSQYKNVRFIFEGSLLHAYLLFGTMGLFSGFMFYLLSSDIDSASANTNIIQSLLFFMLFGLLSPVAWFVFKRYQFNNTYFGTMNFQFNATLWQVYKAMIMPILIGFGFIIISVITMIIGGTIGNESGLGLAVLGVIGIYLAMLIIAPLTQAYLYKVVWENTTLDNSQFALNDFSVFRFAFIQFTNLLMIGLTLGLFMPWAVVRLQRYKTETLCLLSNDDFDTLMTPQVAQVSGIGEEIADVFDLDVSW